MLVRMMLDSAERLLQLISETFSASARAFAFCLVEEFSHHMITDSSQPWEYTVCTMCTTHIDRRGIYAFTSPSLIFNHSTLWPKCFVAFYFGFPSSDDHAASCLVVALAATIVIVLQVFLQLLSNLMNVGSSASCYCVHGSSQHRSAGGGNSPNLCCEKAATPADRTMPTQPLKKHSCHRIGAF